MEKIHKVHFACGELYLFSDVLRMRDPESCLWGVYDRVHSRKLTTVFPWRFPVLPGYCCLVMEWMAPATGIPT